MIFLSHNYKDKPIVEEIAKALAAKYGQDNVFYDSWSIQPGESIIGKMDAGLAKCEFFIYFISQNSIVSNMVKLEWQAALMKHAKKDIAFIPVRLDASEIPHLIEHLLYIDLFSCGITVATRQIIDVIDGRNTFTPKEKFSNVVAYITYGKNSVEIEIRAEHYLEPHAHFVILMNNQRTDFDFDVPNLIICPPDFYTNLSMADGTKTNCLYIGTQEGLSPNFPMIIKLKPKEGKTIQITGISQKANSNGIYSPIQAMVRYTDFLKRYEMSTKFTTNINLIESSENLIYDQKAND